MKIGRNDPCHCGSGLKYKKCCLEKDRAASAASHPAETSSVAASAAPADTPARPKAPPSHAGPLSPRRGPPPPRPTQVRKRAV
jgi:hypothetical protein